MSAAIALCPRVWYDSRFPSGPSGPFAWAPGSAGRAPRSQRGGRGFESLQRPTRLDSAARLTSCFGPKRDPPDAYDQMTAHGARRLPGVVPDAFTDVRSTNVLGILGSLAVVRS